jgi:hypothetical protein
MRYWLDDPGSFSHNFKNLSIIRRSIADLHRRFPGHALLGLQFPSSLSPAIMDAAVAGDPLISAQRILAAMVQHFHLPVNRVAVCFREDLNDPARIMTTADGKRLVEIQSRFKGSSQIVAILAHEIAHFFLDTHSLDYDDTSENEVLTDTTANYLGAGWSVLSAYEYAVSQRFGLNTTWTARWHKLGYLTAEEFGYVLARRCEVTNEDIRPWIKRKEGKVALAAGFARLRRELRQPPLARARVSQRARYKFAVWRSRRSGGAHTKVYDYGPYSIEAAATTKVVFYCPRCTRQLRLPVGVKLAKVSCQGCQHTFDCST